MYTLWDRSTGMTMDFETEAEAKAQMKEWLKLDKQEYGVADKSKYVIHKTLGENNDD